MMNRITWHHTGGTYAPNGTDTYTYHGVIDGDGEVHAGHFPIEANAPGKLTRGAYAAHTRNLNSGNIGRAIAAMGSGIWSDPHGGKWPVKPAQVDALVLDTVRLCRQYSIPVNERQVLSHAEVEVTLGVDQAEKWDFDYDPRAARTTRNPVAIGNELRQEVLLKMGGRNLSSYNDTRPTLWQGVRRNEVVTVQTRLGLTADGIFGPRTRAGVVKFQRANNLLPDGIVGPMTWAALFPTGH